MREAAEDKGRDRHASGEPFDRPPMTLDAPRRPQPTQGELEHFR